MFHERGGSERVRNGEPWWELRAARGAPAGSLLPEESCSPAPRGAPFEATFLSKAKAGGPLSVLSHTSLFLMKLFSYYPFPGWTPAQGCCLPCRGAAEGSSVCGWKACGLWQCPPAPGGKLHLDQSAIEIEAGFQPLSLLWFFSFPGGCLQGVLRDLSVPD